MSLYHISTDSENSVYHLGEVLFSRRELYFKTNRAKLEPTLIESMDALFTPPPGGGGGQTDKTTERIRTPRSAHMCDGCPANSSRTYFALFH